MTSTEPSRRSPGEGYAQARTRREELHEAMHQLEGALAAPLIGRPMAWAAGVAPRLDDLADALDRHVTGNEGPEGLFAEVLEDAPRLASAVARLNGEHQYLLGDMAAVRSELATATDEAGLEKFRERATELLGRLVRHRQRGADVVYDAFQLDIGTE